MSGRIPTPFPGTGTKRNNVEGEPSNFIRINEGTNENINVEGPPPNVPSVVAETNENEDITYDVLGEGGFGAVIMPALPNQINGTRVKYPGNVTKIFKKAIDKKFIVDISGTIADVFDHNNGHNKHNMIIT